MERKGLIGKENREVVDSDNLLYTALSNSYLQGDNLMELTKQPNTKQQIKNLEFFKDLTQNPEFRNELHREQKRLHEEEA